MRTTGVPYLAGRNGKSDWESSDLGNYLTVSCKVAEN